MYFIKYQVRNGGGPKHERVKSYTSLPAMNMNAILKLSHRIDQVTLKKLLYFCLMQLNDGYIDLMIKRVYTPFLRWKNSH